MQAHRHKSSASTAFRCNRGNCQTGFQFHNALLIHMRSHDNKLYKCHFCPWTNFALKEVQKHLNHHFNIRPFACSFCPASFYQIGARKQHEEVKHEIIEDRYKCQLCPFSTYSQKIMQKHRIKHRKSY